MVSPYTSQFIHTSPAIHAHLYSSVEKENQKHPAFTQGVFGFDDPRRGIIFIGGVGSSTLRRRNNRNRHNHNS
jgi:hypothetical protein